MLSDVCQITSCHALQISEFIMCDQYGLLLGVTKSGDATECNRPIFSHGACFFHSSLRL